MVVGTPGRLLDLSGSGAPSVDRALVFCSTRRTAVAARGIDVDGVTHVLDYDCPEADRADLHRIGARAAPVVPASR